MAMKKRWFWFMLSGCALVAVASLWWGQASLVDPEYDPPSATAPEGKVPTQAARGASPTPFSVHQNPVSPEAKPVPNPPPLTVQTFVDPGELKDVANPALITDIEEVVRDTGEFLNPDAEIPPQSLDDVAEPMDTGPFINADPPSH